MLLLSRYLRFDIRPALAVLAFVFTVEIFRELASVGLPLLRYPFRAVIVPHPALPQAACG